MIPPPPRDRPIRASAVWAGIGLALFAHLVIAGLLAAAIWGGGQDPLDQVLISGGLVGELVLFVATVAAGTLLIVKGNRGLGVGVFIGWAVGLIVLPVIGFGVCVYALSGTGY